MVLLVVLAVERLGEEIYLDDGHDGLHGDANDDDDDDANDDDHHQQHQVQPSPAPRQ